MRRGMLWRLLTVVAATGAVAALGGFLGDRSPGAHWRNIGADNGEDVVG
jgi:hypothetical protein